MSSRRVAACVVTGFLGSGKTTLLKGLLERDPGRERIAVIVNEIGEIGIDGRVLTGFEFVENVVEMASGCVCCSIDEYRFDLAVDELVRRIDPALLVLETSGVADPAPTLERLRRCGLGIDAVVTVVDARAWKTAWRISAAARRQVAAADFVVISKIDLVTPRALARVRAGVAGLNARALVLEGAGAAAFVGSDLLLATAAAGRAQAAVLRRDPDAGPGAQGGDGEPGTVGDHLREDEIESFSWRSSGSIDRRAFEMALGELPPAVIRAKGFLRSRGDRAAWLFQVVCGRVEVTAFEGGRAIEEGAQGVFIGPGVAGLRDRIVASLETCVAASHHTA